MNEKVVDLDAKIDPTITVKTENGPVVIKNPDHIEEDFSKLLPEDTLWKQAMLCLTYDGKPLPASAIWGQNKEDLDRISKKPEIFINALQPFVKNFNISKEIIAEQAQRVRSLRDELAQAQNELRDLEKTENQIKNEDVSDSKVFRKKDKKEEDAENGSEVKAEAGDKSETDKTEAVNGDASAEVKQEPDPEAEGMTHGET